MAHIPKDWIESLQGPIAEVLAGWSLSGPHSENWVKDVVMVIRYAVVLAVWAWCLCPTSGFAAIDCGPVKPGTTTDTSIEDNLKGHAQVILKSLGSGEIENGYKQTEGRHPEQVSKRRSARPVALVHLPNVFFTSILNPVKRRSEI
jgi:hypothetical protein